ncbi:hypothetical protein AYL99_11955 [Fonsecaea erecta]|uniref:Uncharacterized protein n=1 Tax=Fonsecaea erecta TaxID=1367422 RepID=A0A178Z1Z8_9EURO|nr:hypothetical protein AYL99_11955 [Fonsecaea erecta]OAP53832.1 hypothetical protein AYL99_11955 [Fonsecaea erecta]
MATPKHASMFLTQVLQPARSHLIRPNPPAESMNHDHEGAKEKERDVSTNPPPKKEGLTQRLQIPSGCRGLVFIIAPTSQEDGNQRGESGDSEGTITLHRQGGSLPVWHVHEDHLDAFLRNVDAASLPPQTGHAHGLGLGFDLSDEGYPEFPATVVGDTSTDRAVPDEEAGLTDQNDESVPHQCTRISLPSRMKTLSTQERTESRVGQ